ncbi:MAG: glycosyltransferase, partial [Muribaculaceae bacterium]|nr:glycosyltransferase [Muribaculaceae bacterium]
VDPPSKEKVAEFQSLLYYYREYFRVIDKFHFNSFQTREKFEAFLCPLEGEVIPVVTKGIADRRRSLEFHDRITFGYIGAPDDYKGFPMLKRVVCELYEEGIRNITIKAYGSQNMGIDEDCPLIEYCGMYKYSDISDVLYHLDGIVVPSKCYETFSLVTLESLAHGRPAIVSDHVGAKDIVKKITPELIFSSGDELKEILMKCISDPDYLPMLNHKILSEEWKYGLSENAKEILDLYRELLRVL